MNVDAVSSPGAALQQQSRPTEQIDSQRKQKESVASEPQVSPESPKVQPEELLEQIKSVTQGGAYSVRFEKADDSSGLVVKIFDNSTQEVIRQIPAEELLNFKATFEELVGNLVNTKG